MIGSRIWFSLVVLCCGSLGADYLCRTLAGAGDQERMLDRAAKAVAALPTGIGQWQLARSEPFPQSVQRILGCRAHQSRVYVDGQTGDSILLTLLAGSAGSMVAHTPEVCYSSTEFEVDDAFKVESVRGTGEQADAIGHVVFRSKSLAGQRQSVFYAWRKFDGHWETPQHPRLALAGQPMLYKLQLAIVCHDTAVDKNYASDTVRRFLADLLPILDEILKAAPESP
jgi:hypothetical protein